MQETRGKLEAESLQISRKLESVGIPTRLENQGLFVIGDLTGKCEPLDAGYRHINIIPVVAQRDRREVSNELQFFLDSKRVKARYAVITSGQRILLAVTSRASGRNTRGKSASGHPRVGLVV